MTAGPTAQRVFHHTQVWELTETAHVFGAGLLAHAAIDLYGPVRAVVGIAEGGRQPAILAAATVGAPCYHVRARHNTSDDICQPATGLVACDFAGLADPLDGRRLNGTVLLVDDICGTGATFDAVTTGLRPYLDEAAVVITAALCRNVGAATPPHLWLWDVSDWVIFPWEQRPEGAATTPLPLPDTVRSR